MGNRRGSARWIAGAVILLLATACYPARPAEGVTTVLFVRHADRDNGSLSEAGLARADALAHVARKGRVAAIYTTDTERTRLTVEPLADLLHLSPLIYQVGSADQINAFASRLRSDHPGAVVLVVGHNPTVPRTIDAVGGDSADCAIGTTYDEFDDLCIVTIVGPEDVNVLNLQYGAPSP